METDLPTVHEVWRFALPASTVLANTGGDLARPVFWARRMSMYTPAFAAQEEGDIVLLSVANIRLLDDRLTLAKVVTSLAQRDVAAVAIVGEVLSEARAVADAHRICLLVLPDGVDLRDVERDVIRLIVERQAQLDRRGREIYRQLAQFSIENRGLAAIAGALHDIVGKPVAIQNEYLLVQTLISTATCPFSPKDLAALLADPSSLPAWPSDGPLDGKAPPSVVVGLPGGDWVRCVTAIVVEGQLIGYLSILGAKDSLDDLDRLAGERGSLVCAVELAKQRAVEAAEFRLRGDFLDMLLTAGTIGEAALARRAGEMEYALDRYHAVALFVVTGGNASRGRSLIAQALRDGVSETSIQVFFGTYEGMLAALCSAPDEVQLRFLLRSVLAGRERVTALAPDTRMAVGVGKVGYGIAGLRRSFAQAQEAVSLVQNFFAGDRVLSFGDLGLYHLLHHLNECEESDAFYDQTLVPLIAYDEEHDAQLVTTLGVFFAHHGNVSQTAQALHLHRNSLLYRLERIHEITGMDLNDADDRFALQLALKLKTFSAV